jgi:hypothetical protein
VALLAAGVTPAAIQSGACYWFWLAGNSLGIYTHYITGGKWFVVRDVVFLALAIWGLCG